MNKSNTVRDMVRDYLEREDFDGLVEADGACSCDAADLFPCGEPGEHCEAGHRAPCNCGEGCDFHIVAGRRPLFACPKCGHTSRLWSGSYKAEILAELTLDADGAVESIEVQEESTTWDMVIDCPGCGGDVCHMLRNE